MYGQLHEVWKRELEDPELTKLPLDFYVTLVEYVKKVKEESRMLDKRTLKAVLLRKETENIERMVFELIRTRYWKIVNKAARGEDVSREMLTPDEEHLLGGILPAGETLSGFAADILHGRVPRTVIELKHKRVPVRLLKDVPAVIGADMKTYGPFKTEDVASLPFENANVLVRQGLAEKIVV